MAKILIIEDDPMMQNVYTKAFTFAKHKVESATNGKIGLEKVSEFVPDIILLDIMMPVMNGMQVLDTLKADDKTAEIPVVILTNIASGTREKAKEAIKRGAKNYVIKSDHDPSEVVALVEKILNEEETTDLE